MIYLATFLYYTLISSSVLIYGIGINDVSEIGISKCKDLIFYIKTILCIFLTSLLSWLFTQYILVPLKVVELFPLIAFLIFTIINGFLESMVQITTGKKSVEFIVSYLIVILSIFETSNLLNTLIICFSCLISLLLLVPLCLTFKNTIIRNGNRIDENYYSLLFVFFSIILIVLTVWDIIWINPGVVK